MTLDPEAKARIEAEEAYRAQVRANLGTQERPEPRPNYWTGILLNFLVSGAGLMYLREWGAGLVWLSVAILLSFAVSPFVGWPVGFFGSLWSYNNTYDEKFEVSGDKASKQQDAITRILLLIIAGTLLVGGFLLSQR